MAEMSWQKPASAVPSGRAFGGERLKFLIGGLLLLAAVVYLIVSSTVGGAQYFISVEEIVNNPDYVGQTVRISGAVDGESIVYDSANLIIDFTIANVPTETTDLAQTLHNAVNDPNAARLSVRLEGEVKPDLLVHEAQAILTGVLQADGTFLASELLLKCPSRYEESVPQQADAASEI